MRKGNIFWSSEEEKKKEEPQQIEIYQAGPTTDDSNVTCEQNRIYFYSEVERNKNLKLNKYIRNLDFDLHNRTNILGCFRNTTYVSTYSKLWWLCFLRIFIG